METRSIINSTSKYASCALAGTLCLAVLTGCPEEKKAPPPPPPPPPTEPPPPPKPAVTPVAQLMKELNISSKIRLPEELAPATDPERVAVLKFFDAFAKGQPEAAKAAMGPVDKEILELMAKSGAFKSSTEKLDRIDLAAGNVSGKPYIVAVFASGELFQPQLWAYAVEGEERTIKSQTFDSYAQLPDMMNKVSGSKDQWIPKWIEIVAKERDQGQQPDEIINKIARAPKEGGPEESGGGATKSNGPVGAPPMRRPPPAQPMKPPDFKPGGN